MDNEETDILSVDNNAVSIDTKQDDDSTKSSNGETPKKKKAPYSTLDLFNDIKEATSENFKLLESSKVKQKLNGFAQESKIIIDNFDYFKENLRKVNNYLFQVQTFLKNLSFNTFVATSNATSPLESSSTSVMNNITVLMFYMLHDEDAYCQEIFSILNNALRSLSLVEDTSIAQLYQQGYIKKNPTSRTDGGAENRKIMTLLVEKLKKQQSNKKKHNKKNESMKRKKQPKKEKDTKKKDKKKKKQDDDDETEKSSNKKVDDKEKKSSRKKATKKRKKETEESDNENEDQETKKATKKRKISEDTSKKDQDKAKVVLTDETKPIPSSEKPIKSTMNAEKKSDSNDSDIKTTDKSNDKEKDENVTPIKKKENPPEIIEEVNIKNLVNNVFKITLYQDDTLTKFPTKNEKTSISTVDFTNIPTFTNTEIPSNEKFENVTEDSFLWIPDYIPVLEDGTPNLTTLSNTPLIPSSFDKIFQFTNYVFDMQAWVKAKCHNMNESAIKATLGPFIHNYWLFLKFYISWLEAQNTLLGTTFYARVDTRMKDHIVPTKGIQQLLYDFRIKKDQIRKVLINFQKGIIDAMYNEEKLNSSRNQASVIEEHLKVLHEKKTTIVAYLNKTNQEHLMEFDVNVTSFNFGSRTMIEQEKLLPETNYLNILKDKKIEINLTTKSDNMDNDDVDHVKFSFLTMDSIFLSWLRQGGPSNALPITPGVTTPATYRTSNVFNKSFIVDLINMETQKYFLLFFHQSHHSWIQKSFNIPVEDYILSVSSTHNKADTPSIENITVAHWREANTSAITVQSKTVLPVSTLKVRGAHLYLIPLKNAIDNNSLQDDEVTLLKDYKPNGQKPGFVLPILDLNINPKPTTMSYDKLQAFIANHIFEKLKVPDSSKSSSSSSSSSPYSTIHNFKLHPNPTKNLFNENESKEPSKFRDLIQSSYKKIYSHIFCHLMTSFFWNYFNIVSDKLTVPEYEETSASDQDNKVFQKTGLIHLLINGNVSNASNNEDAKFVKESINVWSMLEKVTSSSSNSEDSLNVDDDSNNNMKDDKEEEVKVDGYHNEEKNIFSDDEEEDQNPFNKYE